MAKTGPNKIKPIDSRPVTQPPEREDGAMYYGYLSLYELRRFARQVGITNAGKLLQDELISRLQHRDRLNHRAIFPKELELPTRPVDIRPLTRPPATQNGTKLYHELSIYEIRRYGFSLGMKNAWDCQESYLFEWLRQRDIAAGIPVIPIKIIKRVQKSVDKNASKTKGSAPNLQEPPNTKGGQGRTNLTNFDITPFGLRSKKVVVDRTAGRKFDEFTPTDLATTFLSQQAPQLSIGAEPSLPLEAEVARSLAEFFMSSEFADSHYLAALVTRDRLRLRPTAPIPNALIGTQFARDNLRQALGMSSTSCLAPVLSILT